MNRAAVDIVTLPDVRGRRTRAWLIAYYVTGSLLIAALVTALLLYVRVTATREFELVFVAYGVVLLLGFVSLTCALIWFANQSATRRELVDALAVVGYRDVNVKRLQAGKTVAHAAGAYLKLRQERDAHGRPWLIVDASPAPR